MAAAQDTIANCTWRSFSRVATMINSWCGSSLRRAQLEGRQFCLEGNGPNCSAKASTEVSFPISLWTDESRSIGMRSELSRWKWTRDTSSRNTCFMTRLRVTLSSGCRTRPRVYHHDVLDVLKHCENVGRHYRTQRHPSQHMEKSTAWKSRVDFFS